MTVTGLVSAVLAFAGSATATVTPYACGTPTVYPVPTPQGDAYGVATGDLNGDGYPDVVTADLASTASVFLNKADGTGALAPATNYPLADANSTADGSQSPVLADFNGDGKLDLATANYYGNSVSILLGKGDGTFGPATTYPSPTPERMVAADFNRDGHVDLAMINDANGTLTLLLNNGDGSFSAPRTINAGGSPNSLTTADYNGDGLPDLATSNANNYNTAMVLINKGGGKFRLPHTYPVGPGPFGIASGDFNGDGASDLVTANSWNNTFSTLFNKGDGSGTFRKATTITGVGGPINISTADMNGDGYADIIAGNAFGSEIYTVLSNGDGSFATPAICHSGAGPPMFVTAADLNKDGKPDIISSNLWSPSISVLLTP